MKQIKKSLALLLALVMCMSFLTFGAMAADPVQGDIVIIHTNDVHNVTASQTGIPDLSPYAKLVALVKEAKGIVGDSNVTLVDAGDSVQGEAIGSLTRGGYPAEIMNEIGYDIVVPGNHEFDFGMERHLELMAMQKAKVISANFTDLQTGKTVYDPYTIVDYGSVKVAYVGMTTPESFTKSTPAYFQNEKGEYIYGFCEDKTGQVLYDAIQKAVDDAIAEGVDYVIAIGHMGIDEQSAPWRSTDVIANTTGIDVFIDGHSHSVIDGKTYENKDGKDVILTQTGSKLSNIGRVVISADGTISASLISLAEYENVDEETLAYLKGVQELFTDDLTDIVGHTDVALTINDPATGARRVRSGETNLGSLCADAYRNILGADIAFVNGGGVRANIAAGDITFGQVISVHPFGNSGCVVEATGQQILDALEMGSRSYPGENGGFLQVSGIEYSININKKSTVEVDEKNVFVKVAGDRRVSDVKVGGVDIDPEATYKLASHNYMLFDSGDGINMFVNNKILVQPVLLDNQILIKYIDEFLGGVVGEEYANPYGQGRIKIIDEPASWADEQVAAAIELGLVPQSMQSKYSFTTTRAEFAMLAVVLYEKVTEEEITIDAEFTDSDNEYVLKAATAGIVRGNGDGTFSPDGALTREMAAQMLANLADALDMSFPAEAAVFTDIGDAAGWSLVAIGQVQAAEIMIGTGGGAFSPKADYTREMSIITILRMFDYVQ